MTVEETRLVDHHLAIRAQDLLVLATALAQTRHRLWVSARVLAVLPLEVVRNDGGDHCGEIVATHFHGLLSKHDHGAFQNAVFLLRLDVDGVDLGVVPADVHEEETLEPVGRSRHRVRYRARRGLVDHGQHVDVDQLGGIQQGLTLMLGEGQRHGNHHISSGLAVLVRHNRHDVVQYHSVQFLHGNVDHIGEATSGKKTQSPGVALGQDEFVGKAALLKRSRLVRLGALTQHLVHSSIHMLRLQNGGALGIVTEEAHVFSKEDRVLHFPLSAGVEHDGGRAVEGLVGDLDELRAKVDSDNMCK